MTIKLRHSTHGNGPGDGVADGVTDGGGTEDQIDSGGGGGAGGAGAGGGGGGGWALSASELVLLAWDVETLATYTNKQLKHKVISTINMSINNESLNQSIAESLNEARIPLDSMVQRSWEIIASQVEAMGHS